MTYPYHINPQTRRANKCYNVARCRFGIPVEEHYETAQEALAARDAREAAVAKVDATAQGSIERTESGIAATPEVASAVEVDGPRGGATRQAMEEDDDDDEAVSGPASAKTPQEFAQKHDARINKLFERQSEQRSFAIGNVRTLAHRIGINLKKRRLDPEKVISKAESILNSDNPIVLSPYLDWAKENLAEVESLQQKIDKKDRAYSGWARYFRVPGGRIHSNVNCRTCNHSWEHPTEFEWLTDLSGKTEEDAVKEYGAVLCTVCYPDAPMEWTDYFDKLAAEKKKVQCPGSGTWDYDLETARLGHATGNYGVCEVCGQKVSITSTGKLRAHRTPSENMKKDDTPSSPIKRNVTRKEIRRGRKRATAGV